MNLECPKCGHEWNYKGNHWRTKCVNCRKKGIITIIKTGVPRIKGTVGTQKGTPSISPDIQDDIMHGNIMDALNKADVNPFNHKNFLKDAIPLILKEEKLKFAFAKACSEKKNSPEKMIRVILKDWLKEKKYYE